MPRPELPSLSNPELTGGPPADAAKPDIDAVEDVYQTVDETGSLKAAARKLQRYGKMRGSEDDPEEAEYVAQKHQVPGADNEEREEGLPEVIPLQEVIEGLWIGDLVAAMDKEGLEERGITNILSVLRPALVFAPQFAHYPLEIDDSADTDIFTHLPSCVAWMQEALDRRRRSFDPSAAKALTLTRDKVISEKAGETKAGGVLVHCQAGMSRSATVVAAYLMQTMELDPMEAVAMIKEKRPVVDPSATFWHQLVLLYNADGRFTLRDRSTRQYYMERTTSQFLNGDGGAPPVDKMAKYPATPTLSAPTSPTGGQRRRKIRCKMCRRHLAVREHMMDHILDQSPIQERTPSVFDLPSPGISSANGSGSTERRPSVVSNIINPLTGQPGAASQSRHDSTFSGVPSPIQPTHDMGTSQDSRHSKRSGTPLSRSTAPGVILTASSPEVSTGGRFAGVDSPIFPISPLVPSPKVTSRTASTDTPRQLQTAEQLASRLPAHLQALRTTPSGTRGLSSSSQSSPTSSPEKIASSYVPAHTFPPTGPSISVTRKTSLLPMAPADSSGGGRMSSENAGPPILANPKCSGYFVEPLTWMERVLKNGDIGGKLVCPNEKCGVKIGNFDWAGVQCGCKEWVTPGFCIHRSKVDEVW